MRVAIATRSMNDYLYDASGELLGLDSVNAGLPRHRLTGTDGLGYFRELLRLDTDWVISLDEDAFVLEPARLLDLVRTMEQGGFAACGMPDGGVMPIRRHNPAACNAFFNVFDLRRARPIWADWGRVAIATHRREYEHLAPPFARRSAFAFDHFERYYGVFFALLDAGERILYLDAEQWSDGVSTLLKDATGAPLLVHAWYTRHWATSYHTRQRIRAVIEHARAAQGLGPSPASADPLATALRARVPASAARILDTEREPTLSTAEQSYDCIVSRQDLAVQRQPERWLRRLRGLLAPGGSLLAALPNVRHHAVVSALLQGRWAPPDRAAVRFFTRREVEKLIHRAGFQLRRLEMLPGEGHAEWLRQGRPGEVRVGGLHVGNLAAHEAEEFFASHFLVEAAPVERPDFGLTSIVLLTHNQLPFTRLCVESILERTDEPFELIFVDNGSGDGTPEYLERLGGARVIRNPDNRGFPAAANQGIRAASGAQVLLLNNDTVVTSGWLTRLLRALHAEPGVGLVGPCSNRVSGEQQVEVRYDDLAGLDGFAWQWGKDHDGRHQDTERLVGFCLLIRREVIDRVGLLDERFGVGCFEDDDYCRRALQAGHRAVIARDAFVHHFGGRTFAGSGVDFAAVMRHNERLYLDKWSGVAASSELAGPSRSTGCQPVSPAPAGWQPALQEEGTLPTCRHEGPPARLRFDVRPAPGGGLLLGCVGIDSSLCMIARNNATTIGPALLSARAAVDDIVVVDTGSTDDTPAIARRLGARVFHFPWCDSFAAARNESLKHARGKWVFWMDSDDASDADNARKLRELIRGPHQPRVLGYVISVHCPGPEPDSDVTVVQHVKLFRNLPQLRWDGRIHEQIIPAIRALDGEIAWTDLYVVHSGYDHSPEGQKRKLQRDLKLLYMELDERPDHPFTLFNLAMTCMDAGRYEDAARYAQKSIAYSPQGSSQLRKAYAYLVSSRERLGQLGAAWEACLEGLKKYPLDDELRFRKAALLHQAGRLEEAEGTYRHLLEVREEVHLGSVVAGIAGHLARHNLALVYRGMGKPEQEEEQWRRIVQEQPGYRPGWNGLA